MSTSLVLASGKKLSQAVAGDAGVQRACAGTLVAIGVAIVKHAFFSTPLDD